MDDPTVRSAKAIGDRQGFGQRPLPERIRTAASASAPANPAPVVDAVELHHGAGLALRLLRQRVLARTRVELELADGTAGLPWPESGQPSIGAFLDRLLSEQNELAAHRARQWPAPRVRAALTSGFRIGADETIDLLCGPPVDEPATAVIAAVLVEFGRRLGALADRATDS